MVANVLEHARAGQSVLVLAPDYVGVERITKLLDAAGLSVEQRAAIVVKPYADLELGAVMTPSPRFDALYEDHLVRERRADAWQSAKQTIADVVMWPE